MSCAAGRLIHDADSHLMELDDGLDPYFEPRLPGRFHASAGCRAALQRNLRPGAALRAYASTKPARRCRMIASACAMIRSISSLQVGTSRTSPATMPHDQTPASIAPSIMIFG